MIRRPNYSQLPDDVIPYFLASGGRDSTAMVLEAWDLGIEGTLVWNNTRFNYSNKPLLDDLSDKTGFPLIEVTYDGDKKPITVLKESFRKIPIAIQKQREGKFSWRNTFPCCHTFKERPMSRYLKSLDKQNIILIMGIKGCDGSFVRRWRLSELRERGVFHRTHKKNGLTYYYPLRDLREADIDYILSEHGLSDLDGTGCNLCPIFCVFENMYKRDADTFLRSVRYAKHLGIDFPGASQERMTKYCSDEEE